MSLSSSKTFVRLRQHLCKDLEDKSNLRELHCLYKHTDNTKELIQIYADNGEKIWVDKNYVKDKQARLEAIVQAYRVKTDAEIAEFYAEYDKFCP